MRILYLNPIGELGGAEKSLLDILATLRAAEPEWRLGLIAGGAGPLVTKAGGLGVTARVVALPASIAGLGDAAGLTWRFGLRSARAAMESIGYLARLRQAIREFHPDIIHTNGFKMHLLGLWARPRQVHVIWHIRDYISRRFVMRRLLQLHRHFCTAAAGISQSVCRDTEAVLGPGVKVYCIYNAVDLANYSPEGPVADLDALSGMAAPESGVVRIGLIATMARWKGHAVFLKALSRLPRGLSYRAYVIGGSIYQTEDSQYGVEELRAVARELKVIDRVGFTGFLADTASAMRALDIVVHASTQPEPFGRVIVEGMACGRAVISSATGGAGELISDGCDALSHPPGDDAVLAERMAELAHSPELRIRLGRAARTTAERRFERGRLAAELIPVYQSIVTGGGAVGERADAAVRCDAG